MAKNVAYAAVLGLLHSQLMAALVVEVVGGDKCIPTSPPRVDSSKGPHWVNGAHWPTKENIQNFGLFTFSAHGKNGLGWPQMGSGGFRPTNPDLADILGRTDLNFENFYFFHFLDPKILDLQVSRSPDSQISRPPDELSDPNLTTLPAHPGIKYVARALAFML